MKRDRIALFGGSFDPPHIGHLSVAIAAAEQFQLDEVRWIPNCISPQKKEIPVVDASHRQQMTKLLISDHPRFSIWDVEIVRGGVSYMVDTIKVATEQKSGIDWYLLLGEDAYASFDSWREPDTIRQKAQIIVYPRNRCSHKIADDAFLLKGNFIDIASSQIRNLISSRNPTPNLLPKSVVDYIDTHRLYQDT